MHKSVHVLMGSVLASFESVQFNRGNGTIRVPADFKVAPVTYVIRLAAGDSGGEMMTAQNGSVEFPK